MSTDAELEQYGFRILPNGRFFSISKDAELGVVHSKKRGRHQYRTTEGTLLASGMDPVTFVKQFWYAKKKTNPSECMVELVNVGTQQVAWQGSLDEFIAQTQGADLTDDERAHLMMLAEDPRITGVYFPGEDLLVLRRCNGRNNPSDDDPGAVAFTLAGIEQHVVVMEGMVVRLDNPRGRSRNACKAGQIRIDRKAYKRKGSKRKGGRRVKPTVVPASSFCIDDPGKKGRRARGSKKGPYKDEPAWIQREGDLGGPGYTKKSTAERHKLLDRCVKRDDYRSCLGKLMALLRSTTLKAATRKTIVADKDWLVKKYGGKGSFGKRTNPDRWRKPDMELAWSTIWYGPGDTAEEIEHVTQVEPGGKVTEYTFLGGYEMYEEGESEWLASTAHVDDLDDDRKTVASGVDYLSNYGGAEKFHTTEALIHDGVLPPRGMTWKEWKKDLEREGNPKRGKRQRNYPMDRPDQMAKTTPATRRLQSHAKKLGVPLTVTLEPNWDGRKRYVFRLTDGRAYADATTEAAATKELDRIVDLYGASLTGRAGNPYQGDAVELAKYRKRRDAWERSGRKGPPPVQPGRHKNVDAGHADYHRRNVIVDSETIERVMQRHGGQNTYLYSLGSLGGNDYVSPSMIDAAISELEAMEKKVKKKADRKELDDLIAELDAYARYSEEHSTKEAGLGDVDSGYAEWLMEDEAVANPSGKKRSKKQRMTNAKGDKLYYVTYGTWVEGVSQVWPEAVVIKAPSQTRAREAFLDAVRHDGDDFWPKDVFEEMSVDSDGKNLFVISVDDEPYYLELFDVEEVASLDAAKKKAKDLVRMDRKPLRLYRAERGGQLMRSTRGEKASNPCGCSHREMNPRTKAAARRLANGW